MTEGIGNILPDENAATHEHRKKRYKYRYKKKRSGKKKIKRYLEFLLWMVVLAAFIVSLVILIKQMDLTDEKVKKKRRKGEIMFSPPNSPQVCKLQSGYIISHDNLI